MQQVLRRRRPRARVDLGEQAAVVHDGARQHRRGDVDHRRGVADPGHEQLRRRRDRERRRRRHVQGPADRRRSTRRGRGRAAAQQPARHAGRRRRAIKRFSDDHRRGDGAGPAPAPTSPTATRRSTASQVRGVSADYVEFTSYDAERGRLMSRIEVERVAPGRAPRLRTPPTGCSGRQPARQDHPDRRRALPRRRRQREEGLACSASRRTSSSSIPLGAFQKLFGVAAQSLELTVKPRDPTLIERRWTRRAWRCASTRELQPEASRTTSACTRPTRCSSIYQHVHQRHLRGARRRGRAVAGRRRHRHHEHHADGGQRADARDRPAQGARREAARHHVADADRVDDAVDRRRAWSARCSASRARADRRQLTPLPAARRALVGGRSASA